VNRTGIVGGPLAWVGRLRPAHRTVPHVRPGSDPIRGSLEI